MAKGKKYGGRVAGVANKATVQAREAIAAFVEGNTHRLQQWLDDVATDSPEKAFNLFQSVVEYHIPKLARTEHTGLDGGAIKTESTITPVDSEVIKNYIERTKK